MKTGLAILAALVWLLPSSCSDTRTVTISLNGATYDIPRRYFPRRISIPRERENPGNFYMEIYLPEFTPDATRELPSQKRGGHGDKVLVQVARQPHVLNGRFARYAAERNLSQPFRDEHGLRSFRAAPLPSSGRAQPLPDRHILFAHIDQAVTVLIECQPGHRSPPCKHHFDWSGLGFSLTYGMKHLQDWKRIQSGVVDVLQALERRSS